MLAGTVARSAFERLGYAAALLILVAVAGATVAAGNGSDRPLNAHEILVAQTATEMQERGDHLVPFYNGLIRLEKPPLPYWLTTMVHRALDQTPSARVSELEVRIPSLVAGLLLLLVTFQLGVVAFDDQRVGLVAAAILATTSDFFIYSRSGRPEMLYALCCTLQMLGLMIAVRRAEHGLSTRAGTALAWTAAVAAIYAKGPQSPAFFVIGTSLALVTRRPRLAPAKTLGLWPGLLFAAVVVGPYFIYLAKQTEGAVGFWTAQLVQDKPIPLWLRPLRLFYPAALIVGMAPWLVGIGLVLRDVWKRRHPSVVVLASCIAVTIVCLSFVGKLRHHYILPATPLCAVLAAAAVVDLFERVRVGEIPLRTLRSLGIAQATLTGLGLLAGVWMSLQPQPLTSATIWPTALPWIAGSAVLVAAGLRITLTRPAAAFVGFVSSLLVGWAAVSLSGIDSRPRWVLAARFAEDVAAVTQADETLYLDSGIEESLVYYGRRRVVWSKVKDWLAAHPRGRPPLFVCEGSCNDAVGRVIIVQRGVPPDQAMRLVRPRRLRSAPGPDSSAASEAPAANLP